MNYGKLIMTVVIIGVLFIVGIIILASCGYVYHGVDANEIGLQFEKLTLKAVVPPGVYTDIGLWKEIYDVKVEGLAFCAEDPEVLTQDQQRIGVKVCGIVQRPGVEKAAEYTALWSAYRTYYMSNESVVGPLPEGQTDLMTNLGQQAMKVCVGNRPYDESVVGAARDVLRECIDSEISKLATPYGLDVKNIVVPNVVLNQAVQALLDQITDERFKTDLEKQQTLKAAAEAQRKLAEQQGAIMVEQGKVQEQRRQEAITAELEKSALEAQMQVIVAKKANELKEALLKKEVTQADLEVAKLQAQVSLAKEIMLAGLYADSPEYLALLVTHEWAAAWNETDKIIIPAGTNPTMVLSPSGVMPVVPVVQPTPTPTP